MKISDISLYDQEQINRILTHMNEKISGINEHTFVNSKGCQYFSNKGEPIWPANMSGKRWMIEIEIQGYKVDPNEIFSPVWKLINVVDMISYPTVADMDIGYSIF